MVGHVLGDAVDTVRRRTISDLPVRAVLTAAEDADLVVVGARGLGGFKGLLLGSVSHGVLRGAPCPVAVVRGAGSSGSVRRIVVGVDGSPTADAALTWAIAAARDHGAVVEVVHAWQPSQLTPATSFALADVTAAEAAAQRLLDEVVDATDTEGVTVERTLTLAAPGRGLVEAAERADLVVVGARGHGLLANLVLGSVSQQVVQHAPRPVVVVPG
jgi:nucleotide-binding universal stress UspA family protein